MQISYSKKYQSVNVSMASLQGLLHNDLINVLHQNFISLFFCCLTDFLFLKNGGRIVNDYRL